MQHELVIEFRDVERAGILCPACGAELVISLANRKFYGETCPNCGVGWGELNKVFGAIQKAREMLAASGVRLRFRFTDEEEGDKETEPAS